MEAIIVVRAGNASLSEQDRADFEQITSFEQLVLNEQSKGS